MTLCLRSIHQPWLLTRILVASGLAGYGWGVLEAVLWERAKSIRNDRDCCAAMLPCAVLCLCFCALLCLCCAVL